MGYYVTIVETSTPEVTLPLEHEDEAFKRFMDMSVKYHDQKHGGSSTGEKWFSWMNDYETECLDAKDVLERLGFDVDLSVNGLTPISYDSKIGQEALFFNEIADLLTPGYIEWQGEDGDRYRWVFDGTSMVEKQAHISWD